MAMRGTQFAELSVFVAVAEHKSFTKAAAQLGLSRSSISQVIGSFEDRIGVRLLNRTTRSVALTNAGERLLSQAQPVLEGIDSAIESLNAFRDKPAGTLRLNMPRIAASLLVGPLLPKFLLNYPDIKLEVAADDSHSDIVSGHFDAGIRIGERIARDMIALRLFDEPKMVVVSSPKVVKKNGCPKVPQDLHALNCVRLRSDWDGSIEPWTFEKDGRRIELAVDGSLVLNDRHLILNVLLEGIGFGYLPESLVRSHLANKRLVQCLADWSINLSGVFLYYPSRRQMPGPLRSFIDFMRAQSSAFG